VFHVVPDGETVSIADEQISQSGLFMLPRIHSFGICCEERARQIIAFLGHPEKDLSPLFIIQEDQYVLRQSPERAIGNLN
jgi:hypothetical protein